MTAPSIPLSVLDLAPVPAGTMAAEALNNSLDLGQHVERLGYQRHWVAETQGQGEANGAAAALDRVEVGPARRPRRWRSRACAARDGAATPSAALRPARGHTVDDQIPSERLMESLAKPSEMPGRIGVRRQVRAIIHDLAANRSAIAG